MEEQNKKDEEYLGVEDQRQSPVRDNLENPPSTSSIIFIGGHLPLVELELIPFTHLRNMMLYA